MIESRKFYPEINDEAIKTIGDVLEEAAPEEEEEEEIKEVKLLFLFILILFF